MSNSDQYKLSAVLNSAYKPIKFRIKGKNHYQVFLSIQSDNFDPDLDKVLYVEYELHPTFKERVRISKTKRTSFEIEIKAWGTFDVKVNVYLKTGDEITFTQNYGDVLQRKAL